MSERLAKKREPIAFPTAANLGERKLTFRGLYDVCLTFKTDRRVVGNDLSADGRDFVIVTAPIKAERPLSCAAWDWRN